MKGIYVMLTFNGEEMPIRAIESIEKNDGSNVILIDNGSKESYYRWLDDEIKRKGWKDEFVYLVRLPRNRGWAEGNNIGMKIAKNLGYDIALLVNDDIEVRKPTLKPVIEYMEKYEDVGVVGVKVVHGDRELLTYKPYTPLFIAMESLFGTKIAWRVLSLLGEEIVLDKYTTKPTEVDWVIGAAMAVRLVDIYFPAMSYPGHEEHLLSIIMKKLKYKTIYLPVGEIYHFGHKTYKRRLQKHFPVARYLFKAGYPLSTVLLTMFAVKLYEIGLSPKAVYNAFRRR